MSIRENIRLIARTPLMFYALMLQVENLVCIELSYINTKHPDFTEAQIVHRALTEDRDGIKQLRKELQNKQIDEKDNRVGLYSMPDKYSLNPFGPNCSLSFASRPSDS